MRKNAFSSTYPTVHRVIYLSVTFHTRTHSLILNAERSSRFLMGFLPPLRLLPGLRFSARSSRFGVESCRLVLFRYALRSFLFFVTRGCRFVAVGSVGLGRRPGRAGAVCGAVGGGSVGLRHAATRRAAKFDFSLVSRGKVRVSTNPELTRGPRPG